MDVGDEFEMLKTHDFVQQGTLIARWMEGRKYRVTEVNRGEVDRIIKSGAAKPADPVGGSMAVENRAPKRTGPAAPRAKVTGTSRVKGNLPKRKSRLGKAK